MKSKLLLIFGFLLTGLFLWICYSLAQTEYCFVSASDVRVCQTNYEKFLSSPPNEKGDTLAGLAGSLAFLWIIITVLLQGQELSLQREEMEKMRDTQQQQTEYLRLQSKRDDEASKDEKIESMLVTLESTLPSIAFKEFILNNSDSEKTITKRVTFISNASSAPKGKMTTRSWDTLVDAITKSISDLVDSKNYYVTEPWRPTPWYACLSQVDAIINEAQHASEATQEKVYYNLKLLSFRQTLKTALENDDMWAGNKRHLQAIYQ